jgi:hypothetical protein
MTCLEKICQECNHDTVRWYATQYNIRQIVEKEIENKRLDIAKSRANEEYGGIEGWPVTLITEGP